MIFLQLQSARIFRIVCIQNALVRIRKKVHTQWGYLHFLANRIVQLPLMQRRDWLMPSGKLAWTARQG